MRRARLWIPAARLEAARKRWGTDEDLLLVQVPAQDAAIAAGREASVAAGEAAAVTAGREAEAAEGAAADAEAAGGPEAAWAEAGEGGRGAVGQEGGLEQPSHVGGQATTGVPVPGHRIVYG